MSDSTEELDFIQIVAETQKESDITGAWLIEFENGIELWMPKSQCTMSGLHLIEAPTWLVEEKELDLYVV